MAPDKVSCPPDLSARPHNLTVERTMTLDVGAVYLAWTEGFEAVRAARAAGLDGDDIEAVFASVLHESAERGVA